MPEETAVVIVNWNGSSFIDPLLLSVVKEKPAEILLVDNASSDASLRQAGRFPQVRVIRNPSNVGFGRAANQGIEASTAPFILILNVDTELMPGALDRLETFLKMNREAGIVAPQLVFPDMRLQTSCRKFPTASRLFLYFSFLDRIFPGSYRLPSHDHLSTREIEQPMGAALMIRREAAAAVGGFDSDFFLYMEDVDLCERIRKSGWKIYYLPEAQVIHHAGGSSMQDWERSQTNFFQSLILYFRKRESIGRLNVLKFSITAALIVRSLVLFIFLQWRKAKFYFKMSWKLFGY